MKIENKKISGDISQLDGRLKIFQQGQNLVKFQQIIARRIKLSYKTQIMPFISFGLYVYMLGKSQVKALYKYSLVILIFDFEIFLLNFSQERSGENFPAGRPKKFSRYFMQQIVECVCLTSNILAN